MPCALCAHADARPCAPFSLFVPRSVTVGAGGAGGAAGFAGGKGGDSVISGGGFSAIARASGGAGGATPTGDGGSGFGCGGAAGTGAGSNATAFPVTVLSGGVGGCGYESSSTSGGPGSSVAIVVNDGANNQLRYAGLLNLSNVGCGGGGGGSNQGGGGGGKTGPGAVGSSASANGDDGAYGGGGGGCGDSRGAPRSGGKGGDGIALVFFCSGSMPATSGLALADLAAGKPPPSTAAITMFSGDGRGTEGTMVGIGGGGGRRLQSACVNGTWGTGGVEPCSPCKVCASFGAAFATTANCTISSDTVCADTSPCGLAIAAAAANATAATPCIAGCSWSFAGTYPCSRCSACEGGANASLECAATKDTVCPDVPCVPGSTYSASGVAPCVPCTSCSAKYGTQALTPCVAIADATCLSNSWSPTLSGYAGLAMARVGPAEGVTLLADIFALNSALLGANLPLVLQRAVPAGPAYFFVPDGLGDSRPGQGGVRVSTGVGVGNSSAFSASIVAAVAGLDVGVVQARWTLFGAPSAVLEPGAFKLNGSSFVGVSHLHRLNFASASLSVVVPPGTLYPGYVYAVQVDLDLAVGLAFDYSALRAGALPPGAFAAATPINLTSLNAAAQARAFDRSGFLYGASQSGGGYTSVTTRLLRRAFLYVHAPPSGVAAALARAPGLTQQQFFVTPGAVADDSAVWAPASAPPPINVTLAWALANLPLGPAGVLAIYGAVAQSLPVLPLAAAVDAAAAPAAPVPSSVSNAAEALAAAALVGSAPFAGGQAAIVPGFASSFSVNATATNNTATTAAVTTTTALSPAKAALALASAPGAFIVSPIASAAALQANRLLSSLLRNPGVPRHNATTVAWFYFADATGAAALPAANASAGQSASANPAAAAMLQLALANASGLPGWLAIPGAPTNFTLPPGPAVRVAALAVDSEGARAVAVALPPALVCPPGFFAPISGLSCSACAGGTFSAAVGLAATAAVPQPCSLCGEGQACFIGATNASVTCPAFWFCAAGAAPALCPPGTTSAAGSASCSPCPAGSACAGNGTAPIACAAGSAAAEGAAACTPCVSGVSFAADAGAATCGPCTPTTCGAGNFTVACSNVSDTSCAHCAAGFFSPPGGLSASCSACSSCGANQSVASPCSAAADTVCSCSAGFAQVVTNSSSLAACLPCINGSTFSSASSSPTCSACSTCSAGSAPLRACNVTSDTSCNTCPPGAFAPLGAAACTSCPAGSFASAAGAAGCTPCPAGSFASAAGAASCTPHSVCQAGYAPSAAGTASADVICGPCPAGLSSPLGSTSAANCTACAQSFFCAFGAPPAPCPAGTVSPPGSTSAANCSAISAASVAGVIDALSNVTSPAGALGALATASSISSFLDANATAAGGGGGGNSTGGNATEVLAAATAARGAVIAQIGGLVSILAGGSAASFVGAANATGSSSVNNTAFAALLADTSIPLTSNATAAVAQALSTLTSSASQLSPAAASDALDALSAISLLSLPVNVLSGAVDAAGAGSNAPVNATPAAAVPPLPPATATLFLGVISNVLVAAATTAPPTDGSAESTASAAAAAAAVQVKVAAALGSVSAAVLRASAVGDPPLTVTAGVPGAFGTGRRRLTSAPFCGDALSLSVQRLAVNASLALPIGRPIAPCGPSSAAIAAPVLSAASAFLVGASRGASSLGLAASSVDVRFVQMGRSPVSETAGFAALGALGPPAPLDTRVVSVVLQSRAGAPIVVANSSSPLSLTLPLASGGNGSASAAVVAAALYSRPFRSVVCPASARASVTAVDCGAPVGVRNVTCEAAAAAYNGTFRCPALSVQPQCVWWDASAAAWSSAGCVALPAAPGGPAAQQSISCACNHTTEFAARFAALAAQQEDIFANGADLFVQPGAKFQQYPHVAAILGVILALLVVSLTAADALDREGGGRFYESLQADREVQFLAKIENIKGGVFVLDRVLDKRVDSFQEHIAQARLEGQARAIAEAEGLVFLQRGVALPPDLEGAVSVRHVASANVRRYGAWTSAVLAALGRGDGARAAAGPNLSSVSVIGDEPFAHTNKFFVKRAADAGKGAAAGGAAAAAGAAHAAAIAPPPPAGDAARAISPFVGDTFARAIYARLTRSFELLSVSGGRNSRLEQLWHSGAAGISADVAAALGLEKRAEGAGAAAAAGGGGGSGEEKGAELLPEARPASLAHGASAKALATLLKDSEEDALSARRAEAAEAEDLRLAGSVDREAENVLDQVGGNSFVRAWTLRAFLGRTWALSVLYQHPVLGIFSKFDPRLSRTLRVLVLASSLIADLWTTTFLYAFVVGGDANNPLPPLTIPETIVVALLSSLLQVPIGTIIGILATRAGEAEFAFRYPFISAELQRRKETEARLARLSKKALEAELAAISTEAPQGAASEPAAAPAAAIAAPEPAADFGHGWVDAPAELQSHCAPLLRCCGRAPEQRAAFVARARAAEEARAAVLAKRKARAAALKSREHPLLATLGLGRGSGAAAAGASAAAGTGAAAAIATAGADDEGEGEQRDEESAFASVGNDNGDVALAALACCIGALGGQRFARNATAAAAGAAAAALRRSSRTLSATSMGAAAGAQAATAAERAKRVCGPAVRCCRRMPCTAATVLAQGVTWAVVAFFLWYITSFGFRHDAATTLSFTIAWASGQLSSLFLVAPIVALANVVFVYAVFPAWLPWIVWIPVLGRLVAGKAAAAIVTDDGGCALSGRLESLALVRAAGAASLLSGEAAVLAYGTGAVLSAAATGVLRVATGAGEGAGADKKSSEAFRSLTSEQRSELVVRHYMVLQLRAAEKARAKNKALAKGLAFASSRPKAATKAIAAAAAAAAAEAVVAPAAAPGPPKRFAVGAAALIAPAPVAAVTGASPAPASAAASLPAALPAAAVAAPAPAAAGVAAELATEREAAAALEAASEFLAAAESGVPAMPTSATAPRARADFTGRGGARRSGERHPKREGKPSDT